MMRSPRRTGSTRSGRKPKRNTSKAEVDKASAEVKKHGSGLHLAVVTPEALQPPKINRGQVTVIPEAPKQREMCHVILPSSGKGQDPVAALGVVEKVKWDRVKVRITHKMEQATEVYVKKVEEVREVSIGRVGKVRISRNR